ncbi:zinc ABC transporter permease subunit ZnuB [Buchnera aphidicola]|uniref:zinc ABC transporter permease subunit ZnuB n=1 Tax=Buchnera aphidicola TaxID=9 RepID=UPI000189C6A9|nr:zinc ABC transporter permease subunit ZnuB [Buchnera aphidicola]ACL30124.1 high-affinity zinc uptake system membrane protein ZnuB [Buchnera aphidicola str. Tuc7 (Acyrthosiphon pisum)]ADP66137.1 high-affinity zinc uptake system membrane protein ZnuB [Buchnera aphidicola str. LL01 (Acyrthosiphon pisum)]ADP66709.1 high-affinity zinc uptake system membrane protein ZnuB [Buchnera aphidicola str. TLW03 (Acyrthosiphon pisum)]ADP67291.1 high-affinity zinc uptake system membrane protein ZnuB [Buchner
MFELIFPGWLAGVLLSLTTGPLGSFIVWRRMSSFGDTLSHSSLLGIALSIAFNVNSFYAILILMSFIAIILAWLEELLPVSLDTVLNIISHSSLSLGMVFISLISSKKEINITNYLFGDLLSVTKNDLITISISSILILSILLFRWHSILSSTINEELSQIDGINVLYARLTIMLMTAFTIAIAIKFVGALLITSLLIIPPATAQHFSGSPEKMVIIAIIVSILSVTGGISLSVFYNTPASPSIVLCSSFLCLISNIKKHFY